MKIDLFDRVCLGIMIIGLVLLNVNLTFAVWDLSATLKIYIGIHNILKIEEQTK